GRDEPCAVCDSCSFADGECRGEAYVESGCGADCGGGSLSRREVLRIFFAMLVACGLVQATALAQTKPDAATARYEITGIVINSVNGNPVPRCHLSTSLSGSPGRSAAGRMRSEEHTSELQSRG